MIAHVELLHFLFRKFNREFAKACVIKTIWRPLLRSASVFVAVFLSHCQPFCSARLLLYTAFRISRSGRFVCKLTEMWRPAEEECDLIAKRFSQAAGGQVNFFSSHI
jgi:hypothetical protein